MKTITLDMKSLAVGLFLGLLIAFLIGVAGCQNIEESEAKYQVATTSDSGGIVIDTHTGELFEFALQVRAKEGGGWDFHTKWRK